VPAELDRMPSPVETIHGHSVADPYRWLEDRASAETGRWIAEQHTRFEDYFLKLGRLDLLRARVNDYLNVETIDQIGRVQDRFFYRKHKVKDPQPSIFIMESADSSERLLVNPADFGPYASVGIGRISADGSLLAYELKQGGEHSKAIFIIDVNSGVRLPDHLDRGLARGFVFRNLNDGFYYCHDPVDVPGVPAKDHAVMFHRFGTHPENDVVLLRLARTRSTKLVLKSDGELLSAIFCHEKVGAAVVDIYTSRQSRDTGWQRICENVPMPFGPFFYRERLFAHWFQGTPNGKIVELDVTNGRLSRVIVPEWDAPIHQCSISANRLYVSYLVGTETVVRIWSLDGACLGNLPLDAGHTWRILPGHAHQTDEFFLECQSFNKAPALFRCQGATAERTLWAQRYAPSSATSIVARKLTYLSRDGAEIAISLVSSGDPASLRNCPVIMTAYGGFGLTLTPQFSAFVSVMLELGFLFAVPEIRGGGEHGRQWHEAARGRNRQIAFDDFISAAEWLCMKGFTNPKKLSIFGGSNSGLLVGAAITQRPDLFRAALCVAPLLDMVRYHLFDRARVWTSEYGTADDPDELRALLAYSPYHCVREAVNYPAVLFVCGDKDTRCNPAHARKMAARLQDRRMQRHAILLDHSTERGHAPTMPLSVRVDALTHRIAFLCHELEIPIPQEMQHEPTGR
jgi:prolyl oligopeptidase